MIEIKLADAAWSGAQDGTEALLDIWLVGVGEPVKAGQVIASVVLVKASIDMEAPQDGVLAQVLVQPGESFASGQATALFEPTTL